jgi:CheY-like chemotaxis protein
MACPYSVCGHKRPSRSAALTAFAGTEDRLRVLAAGYQLHIAKPVDPLELVEAITSLVSAIRERRSPAERQ